MLKNVKLTIAYDGAPFLGWQKTIKGPSVEETLIKVLRKILQEEPILQAASRTDAGVHALGQIVNFFTHRPIILEKLKKSLNALLAPSIVVLDIEEVELSFHPTLDAKAKEYIYRISLGDTQFPHDHPTAWHVPGSLDLDKMELGAKELIGKHDFSSFCNARKNMNYTDKIREIFLIQKKKELDRLTIKIAGNHFLYKMVRNIVGTLVYVAKGEIHPSEIRAILALKSRATAGVTAPSHGLTLNKIFYGEMQ